MLAGRRPLESQRQANDSLGCCDLEVTRPSAAISGSLDRSRTVTAAALRGDLDTIVLRALRQEPDRRYASVDQLAEDLRRYLAGLPVMAQRDTVRYRVGKFIRRNRTAVAVAITFALTLLGGIVATTREATLARQERDSARAAQGTAERLNQFLQELLASADPDGRGREIKVVQVLDAAAARIDRELRAEPKVLAQAHLTIARAYLQLRVPERAESHARAALAIDQRLFGDDHPSTAEAMAFLGETLKVFHRFEEAEPLLRRALAVERKSPLGEREALATVLRDEGAVLTRLGRTREALPLLEESLAVSRATSGAESAPVADTLTNLGSIYAQENNFTEAMAAYRSSLEIHRKLKPMRITFLNPLDNLCVLLFRQGKIAEIEALLEEGQRYCRENIGEDNPTYGFILGRLGFLDFIAGRDRVAVPKLKRCLESLRNVYPKTDTDMVLTKAALGVALTRLGNAAEAEQYLREALEEGRETARADLAPIGNLEGALGNCLLAQGKNGEAVPLLRASYAEFASRLGTEDSCTVAARERLAQALSH